MKANLKLRQCFGEHIDKIPFTFVLPLVALVALAVAVMVSECIACYLQQLLGLCDEGGKYAVLKTIGFCITGVLLVWQAWATNKRAKVTEKNAKSAVAGRQEERLKNAIEHLGHESASVCISGAYELFHLAKDTEDLRRTVLDILCAHIRQTTRGDKYKEKHKTKPSEEIQSLLTLLFREEHDIFEGCSINLQGSYLHEAELSKARLQGANLKEAQLQQTQLQGANLFKVRMQGANLSKAQLQKADLSKAELQGADLELARMQGANLPKAQLQGADLSETQLQGANLKGAQLQGVSSQKTDSLSSSAEFERKIKKRIGKSSDLKGIIFSGGLQQGNLNALCKGLSADQAQALQEILRRHVGKPVNHKLPRSSGAKRGTYTQEEAEQWIAEYNKAM